RDLRRRQRHPARGGARRANPVPRRCRPGPPGTGVAVTLARGPIGGYTISAAPPAERERTIRGAQLQAMLCLQARDERALAQVLLHRGRDGRTVARAIAEA